MSIALVVLIAISVRWLGPAIAESTGIDRVIITPLISLAWLSIYGVIIWLTYEKKA